MSNKPRDYFPEHAADLPQIEYLPDLFEFFDGTRVKSPQGWIERREELRDLMQYYLYGYMHETPESASRFRALSEAEKEERTVEFSFPGMPQPFKIRPEALVEVTDRGVTAGITLDAFRVPQYGVDTEYRAPYPAVICVGSLSEAQQNTLLQNGYAYIAMNTGSVYSDGGNNPRTGAYCELYPYVAGDYEFDSGVLLGWCWGVSRIIDALKNDPSLNVAWDQCAVTGCSRNGKAAALAAAFDDRIAVSAPSDPGGGGLTGFRIFTEGQLHCYDTPPDGYDTVYSRNEFTHRAIANPDESAWFCSKAQEFINADYSRAPFDMHAVAALVAPRPLICWTGEAQQSWLNSPATARDIEAAREVYEFLGVGGNCAAVVRDGPHANQDRDLPDLIAILDVVSGRRGDLEIRDFPLLKNADGDALDGSGVLRATGLYRDIASLSRNPYDIENWYVPWARPGKYTIWSRDKYLTPSQTCTLEIHTDAPVIEFEGTRYPVLGTSIGRGIAKIDVLVEQGRYTVKTVGPLDENSITLTCLSLDDATRYGLNLTGGSPDGMAVGFTSPLIGVPDAFVDGKPLKTGCFDDGTPEAYIERYGVSLKSRAVPNTEAFTFSLRNVRLEALPERVFNVDVPLTKSKVKDWFGNDVDAITSEQGEVPSHLELT